MDRRKISIEDPILLKDITILPIALILQHETHGGNSVQFYVSKEPAAVVVYRGTSRNIYNRTGKEISLDELLDDFPEQAEYIRDRIDGRQRVNRL
jgi:hypothetical protein